MKNNNHNKSNRMLGQGLFELVVAMGIGVLVMTSLVKLITVSIKNTTFAKNQSLATRYAQEGIEWIRGQRDVSWSTLLTYSLDANPTWCINTLNWNTHSVCSSTISSTIFSRKLTLDKTSNSNVDLIEATVVVDWPDGNITHNSRVSIQLSNRN
ncbi:MAG TPA: hypothetical protein DDZ05_00045 [Candidatus Blackburnbacteria bacterium]|uniref:Uncharacterized protein n=1 Tax=Candidatus Blackburnbacteria bacterium RIFCSPLOWO2_01_FULL_40_20 TaxID=1797519 RepID=A0A1G1VFC1_9BACT|nr:MAG: hypothetical protein A3A77_03410 [Candidatus Blackburnbacteria bacterium RIFCSPLOWO2_01_FULL_40_20]HBL51602.1 hypothetical protein [Candidatus Blackburnbacteria bacterium]